MYFATSYHFTLLDGFGNIESTDTWVVKNDSKKNRELTKDWFKRFIKLSEKEYVGDSYIKFLTETTQDNFKRITDGVLTIDVRNHKWLG